jgi:hypothetical protein
MAWLVLRRFRVPVTPQNTTRATVGTIFGLYVLAFIAGVVHGMTLPPYAHVRGRAIKVIAAEVPQLLNKYKIEKLSQLPKGAGEEESKEVKNGIQSLLASVAMPPITLDESCKDMISDLRADPPPRLSVSSLFGFTFTRVEFQVAFKAKTALDEHNSGLVGRTYGSDGSILEEKDLSLKTDASPGEIVIGDFDVTADFSLGYSDEKDNILARACRFAIAKKSEKAK